jgi:lipopolysaccharide transport system permease protein
MDQNIEPTLQHMPPGHMDISAEDSRQSRQRLAVRDVMEGAGLWRLGITLGWLDIKLRYRGSMLGPFWLTISTAVWVAAMGALYSILFHIDLHGYLPYLALSLVLWTALGGVVSDACNTFLQSENVIRSMRMPYFVHAIRVVVRNIINLAHNVPVIIVVFLMFGTSPGPVALWSVPALVLWGFDAFAACLVLGAVCARFRDVPPIVASVMQIAFYVTPIIWRPAQLGGHGWWLPLNPFNALLDVARQPLLGISPGPAMWAAAVAYSALFCVGSWMLFARVRGRIAFWM